MTAANPTPVDIAAGMRAMQQFYGLPETGVMNPDTWNDMSKPRCGVADIDPTLIQADCTTSACRRRRFSLLGQAWDSMSLTYRSDFTLGSGVGFYVSYIQVRFVAVY